MNNIEAMKQWLEELNNLAAWNDGEIGGHMDEPYAAEVARRIIKSLSQAIEQAQVATNDTSQERVVEIPKQRHEPCGLECDCTDVCKQDTYKALWQQMCERCDALDKQLAERTWVGLTDEEMQDLWDRYAHMEMMRAIEAKLKEKNT